jgi:hypothetical protein
MSEENDCESKEDQSPGIFSWEESKACTPLKRDFLRTWWISIFASSVEFVGKFGLGKLPHCMK